MSGSESEQTDSSYELPQRQSRKTQQRNKSRARRPSNNSTKFGKKTNERVKSVSQRNIGSTVR